MSAMHVNAKLTLLHRNKSRAVVRPRQVAWSAVCGALRRRKQSVELTIAIRCERNSPGERTRMATTIEELDKRRELARTHGGEKRIAAQHANGRLTALERLSVL